MYSNKPNYFHSFFFLMYKLVLSFQNKSTQVTGYYLSVQPLTAQSCPTATDSGWNFVKHPSFNTQPRAAGSADWPQISWKKKPHGW